jgi:iron complex transport system substrate-binding protein
MQSTDRIASLLASATEIVALLGLEDRLVAISHECDYPLLVMDRPRASRPVFDVNGRDSGSIDRAVRDALLEHGSVYTVDADLLTRLGPGLILTQGVCDVCAVPATSVLEIVAAAGLHADVLSLDAHTVDDIMDTICAIGRKAGIAAHASAVVAELRARIERVRSAARDRARLRVLSIEWLDPVFLPGHWVPEMIEIAGGENIAGETGKRSVQTTFDTLHGLDPDVLLIMPCGYGLEESLREADRFADALQRIAPRAVRTGRAWVVDGSSYFNRSGPRVVDGIELVDAILGGGEVPGDRAKRIGNG